MKNISAIKFIVLVFVFLWTCWGLAIFTGRPISTFPNMLLYMLGGSGPTLVALFYLFRHFDKDARRRFWSRLIDVHRVRPIWWFLCLFAIPILVLSALALDLVLGAEPVAMPNLEMLMAQPGMIPMFVIMILIGGALSEELRWLVGGRPPCQVSSLRPAAWARIMI